MLSEQTRWRIAAMMDVRERMPDASAIEQRAYIKGFINGASFSHDGK